GIQCILDEINLEDEKEICKLTKIFKEIKKDSEFKKLTTGGGKNYKRPLEDRINFVRDKVLEIYE
ncbi:DUF262 domain-containing protein, partial [Listeria welshimeri]|nr:DUF262 domain-containing protein [Listeria welshimeri]